MFLKHYPINRGYRYSKPWPQRPELSALSELTGLRRVNLLLHLQKLLETDLIIQRHERGDYMISKKGFNLLTILADFQGSLENE